MLIIDHVEHGALGLGPGLALWTVFLIQHVLTGGDVSGRSDVLHRPKNSLDAGVNAGV